MSLSKVTVFALAGSMALGIAPGGLAQDVDPAPANLSPEEAVEIRQAAMKENGGLLRGAGDLTGADAVAAAEVLIKNFTDLPHLFPENSAVGDSNTLPATWENFAEFTAYFTTAVEAATAMKAAAESGDAAVYGESIKTIGGLCGACHQKFRAS
jgi:cytochrome c556